MYGDALVLRDIDSTWRRPQECRPLRELQLLDTLGPRVTKRREPGRESFDTNSAAGGVEVPTRRHERHDGNDSSAVDDMSVTMSTKACVVGDVCVATATRAVGCQQCERYSGDDCFRQRRQELRLRRPRPPPCLGKPCSGCPLFGDASAASGRRWTPFSRRLLRVRDLDFHAHDQLRFRHLPREEAVANIGF